MRQQRMQIQRSYRCQPAASVLIILGLFQTQPGYSSDRESWGSALEDGDSIAQPIDETACFDRSSLIDPSKLPPYSDLNKCYAYTLTWLLSLLPERSLQAAVTFLGSSEPHLFRAAFALNASRRLYPRPEDEVFRSFYVTWIQPNIDFVATEASVAMECDASTQNDPAFLLTHLYAERPFYFHVAFDLRGFLKKDIDLFFLELLPTTEGLPFVKALEEGLPPDWEPPENQQPYFLAINYQKPTRRSLHLSRNVQLKIQLTKADGTKGATHQCELLGMGLYHGNIDMGHHFAFIKTNGGWLHTDSLQVEPEVCVKHVMPKLLLVRWMGPIELTK